jgi:hypothetical protein
MLYEQDVIDAVAAHLRERGYTVRTVAGPTERGVDIVATEPGEPPLKIEAKGGGSSKPGTNRYGQRFSSGQVHDHVAKAVLTAMRVVADRGEVGSAAIALPGNPDHRREVGLVRAALARLEIAIFWVDEETREVFRDPAWPT